MIPFKNRSGTLSFRVSRTVLEERVQKNFPTQLAAEEFRNELLARAKQGDSEPGRTVSTPFASKRDSRSAESALEELQKHAPQSLPLPG
jgi:hypothetical protein